MRKTVVVTATLAAGAVSALAWAFYSRRLTPHALPMPDAVAARRELLASAAGAISFYVSSAAAVRSCEAPLLLIHSVNAAASTYEVRPLFHELGSRRPVYALDLPGFGFSERSARDYTPRLMSDAVLEMAREIRRRHPQAPAPEAIALSLSSEFLANAALQETSLFSTVGFISPTGFTRPSTQGTQGENKVEEIIHSAPEAPVTDAPDTPAGSRRVANTLDSEPWAQPLYDLLVTRPSIRYFLRRAFGSSDVDPDLVDYCYVTAHQPGARHAPLAFLAGRPFSEAPLETYKKLTLPVWMAHGNCGSFSSFPGKSAVEHRPNWTIDVFDSGAMPQFQCLDRLLQRYHAFRGGGAHEPAYVHSRPSLYSR